MKLIPCLISILGLCCGCSDFIGKPVLKSLAQELTPSMSQQEVSTLFAGYHRQDLSGKILGGRETVWLRTGVVPVHTVVYYHEKGFLSFEMLNIYFGEDGNVVGYFYELPD